VSRIDGNLEEKIIKAYKNINNGKEPIISQVKNLNFSNDDEFLEALFSIDLPWNHDDYLKLKAQGKNGFSSDLKPLVVIKSELIKSYVYVAAVSPTDKTMAYGVFSIYGESPEIGTFDLAGLQASFEVYDIELARDHKHDALNKTLADTYKNLKA